MNTIRLSAFAKINLTLAITGTLENGYHRLETVMQRISLADTVELEPIPAGILLSCSDPSLPTDRRNLCYQAAERYFQASGLSGGVKIHLIKNIPHGAGLGGGSADGAAVLLGLQQLYPSSADLSSVAASLGADLPFCLQKKTCLCEGIGEALTPIPFASKKALSCVIVKGAEGLSTPEVYRCFDRLASKPSPSRVKAWVKAAESGNCRELFSAMQNDLELPAISLLPVIGEIKSRLLSLGADAAMMTGSGSAVFGLFLQEDAAKKAAAFLQKERLFAKYCTLL
jgi:4-diphosphocytidyl-2-C-methyl-D-erythritol kinase